MCNGKVLHGICALLEVLRSVLWKFVTDISGQLIDRIFKGPVVQVEFLVSTLIILDFEKVSLWFRECCRADRQTDRCPR